MEYEEDYYSVLELSRNATEADVKKAYRKMALRWHPDKNQSNQAEAERRFKLISEAYEVLGDTEKRRVYDQFGKAGLVELQAASQEGDEFGGRSRQHQQPRRPQGPSANYHHFRDPRDLFREFFGPGDPMTKIFYNPNNYRSFEESTERQRTSNLNRGFAASNMDQFFSSFMSSAFNNPGAFASNVSASNNQSRISARGPQSGSQLPPLHGVRTTRTFTSVGGNGRKIVTRKVVENGVETVTVTEFDQHNIIIGQTVNGHPVSLTDDEWKSQLKVH